MSIRLEKAGIDIKTYDPAVGVGVLIGDHEIPLDEFCLAVVYVLTNSDLVVMGDPRAELVDHIKKLERVPGFNPGRVRLSSGV